MSRCALCRDCKSVWLCHWYRRQQRHRNNADWVIYVLSTCNVNYERLALRTTRRNSKGRWWTNYDRSLLHSARAMDERSSLGSDQSKLWSRSVSFRNGSWPEILGLRGQHASKSCRTCWIPKNDVLCLESERIWFTGDKRVRSCKQRGGKSPFSHVRDEYSHRQTLFESKWSRWWA